MKLFWNYKKDSENLLNILKLIVGDNTLRIIYLPEFIKDSIRISSDLTIEELEKMDKSDLKKVIFEFKPKAIYKITYSFIDENLEDIFLNLISEHRFSYCSCELSEEEYNEIINCLKDRRIVLNRIAKECMESLETVVMIYKNKMKIPSKNQCDIRNNFLKNIDFINNIRSQLRHENFKYLDKLKEELITLCSSKDEDLNLLLSRFINTYVLKKNLCVKHIEKRILDLTKDYSNLVEEKRVEEIIQLSFEIWISNEGKIISSLCFENEDFTEENIYEKLKYWFEEYITEKEVFLELEKEFDSRKGLDSYEQEFTRENIRIFLQNLNSELLLNYLKLFLFCCRPNEFIEEEDILDKINVYKILCEYIRNVDENKIISKDIKDLLFNEKIKNLLLIFQEKVISFPKEKLKLNNPFITELREKLHSQLNEEYIENFLKFLNNLQLANKEFYLNCISNTLKIQNDFMKPEIINIFKDIEEYEKLYNVNILSRFWGVERLKKMLNTEIKKEMKKPCKVLDENYLERIKEFAFSNLKRARIYYKIFLLNILFKIDEKDIEKFLKDKGYIGNNYLTYFKALKRNEKRLGKEHLRYILNYLDEIDKKERQNLIDCINYLTIYNENFLFDILSLEEYEEIYLK